MSCPQTQFALRRLSGELDAAEKLAFDEHLRSCAVCRAEWEKLSATWEQLGAWSIDTAGIDLTERILAATEARVVPFERVKPSLFHRTAFRAAASIAIATGLGVGSGYLLPAHRSQQNPPPTLAGVSEALDWIETESESATGLVADWDGAETGDEGAQS